MRGVACAGASVLGLLVTSDAVALRQGQHSADTEQKLGFRSWSQARDKARTVVSQLSLEEKYALVHGSNSYSLGWYVGNTPPILRVGVPALTMQDAGNGFRPHVPGTHGSTVMWPSLLALAATWDENLTEQVAAAMGREFRGKGANVMLGPSINVHRVTSNGRNFEYLSGEDPYLGARMVRPFVRGVQSEGVVACVKHYAFNEQETNRGTDSKGVTSSSNVDERTAWELYYPPFEAAVDEGVGAFMCSYNKVNGTFACENPELIKRDLKQKMGFQGFVMSDWGATHTSDALVSGLDQDMPGGADHLLATANLTVNPKRREATNEAATRILSTIYRLRLDERKGCMPPLCFFDMLAPQRNAKSVALAADAATQAVTLLQNDGTLPLDPARVKTLAVLGLAAVAPPAKEAMGVAPDFYAGGGSGHVSANDVVTAYEGILERASQQGIKVLMNLGFDHEDAKNTARQADVVIVVGATTATEGMDRSSLDLAFGVNELISAVAPLKPTVVLTQTPGAIVTPWRKNVAAIANLFLGGEETGHAFARVLFGDVSPSGKLPIMFPATEKDVIKPDISNVTYGEGLFTSYRSPILKAAFPFGHGLSYTSFGYSAAQVYKEGCTAHTCVRMMVINTGKRPGSETAQAYLRFPRGSGEPALVLRGFRKTQVLQPRQAEEVLFLFTERDLSVYRPEMGGWVVQRGVEAHIGSSSADIRATVAL